MVTAAVCARGLQGGLTQRAEDWDVPRQSPCWDSDAGPGEAGDARESQATRTLLNSPFSTHPGNSPRVAFLLERSLGPCLTDADLLWQSLA